MTRENRSPFESRPEQIWQDSEISAGDAQAEGPGAGQRPRIRRPGGPPLATPVAPDKAAAILASLERIEAGTEQGSEPEPKKPTKAEKTPTPDKTESKQKKPKRAPAEPRRQSPAPEAEPKKQKTKRAPAEPQRQNPESEPRRKPKKAPAGPRRRRLRTYGWAMFAGALVAVLAGGTIGVVDAGRHHTTADVSGGAPTGAAAPADTPNTGRNPVPTDTAGTGSATATPGTPSAPGVTPGPTSAAASEVGAWPLTANAVASFGASSASGVASHVSFATGAAGFTGAVNSEITTPAPMLQTGPGASFTVSAWVDLTSMPTSASKAATAVSQGAGIDSAFYLQYFEPTNRWAFARMDTDTAVSKAARTEALAVARMNVWTHLVGVYSASTGTVSLYVDSVAQGTTTDTTPFASASGLEIGGARYNNAASDGFTGAIKDVSVYSQALSAQEVAALN